MGALLNGSLSSVVCHLSNKNECVQLVYLGTGEQFVAELGAEIALKLPQTSDFSITFAPDIHQLAEYVYCKRPIDANVVVWGVLTLLQKDSRLDSQHIVQWMSALLEADINFADNINLALKIDNGRSLNHLLERLIAVEVIKDFKDVDNH